MELTKSITMNGTKKKGGKRLGHEQDLCASKVVLCQLLYKLTIFRPRGCVFLHEGVLCSDFCEFQTVFGKCLIYNMLDR